MEDSVSNLRRRVSVGADMIPTALCTKVKSITDHRLNDAP